MIVSIIIFCLLTLFILFPICCEIGMIIHHIRRKKLKIMSIPQHKMPQWQKEIFHAANSKLRINIKSLSAESKFIRQEIQKCRSDSIKGSLNTHRIENVRKEARSAHLALACLRGTPYIVCERGAKNEPDWVRIKEKIYSHIRIDSMREPLEKWLREAKKEFN